MLNSRTAREVAKNLNRDTFWNTEPILLEKLHEKSAKSGRTVSFVCTVVAGKVTEFLWTKQGQLIRNDAKFRINIDSEASILLIRNVDHNDSGDYMCVAKNPFSEDRVTATLKVEGNADTIAFLIRHKSSEFCHSRGSFNESRNIKGYLSWNFAKLQVTGNDSGVPA